MLFKGRIERLVNVEKSEEKFRKEIETVELEKLDMPAMIIAAFSVFLPAILLILGVFVFIIWLFFLR